MLTELRKEETKETSTKNRKKYKKGQVRTEEYNDWKENKLEVINSK